MIAQYLAFVLLASPLAFKTTREVFGTWIASPEGLATLPGLLLHALVFVLLFRRAVSTFPTMDQADDASNANYQKNRFVF
jgi:hypothetical protein